MISSLPIRDERLLDQQALDVLFHAARTANGFLPQPVTDQTLRDIVEATKMAPTAMNALPLRVVFVTSDEGRARLITRTGQRCES